MNSPVRNAELYVTRRVTTALRLACIEGQTPDALADNYLVDCIERDHPGLLALVDECDNRYGETRAINQDKFAQWKISRKKT